MKLIAIEEVRNYEKLYLLKIFLEMPGERNKPTYA